MKLGVIPTLAPYLRPLFRETFVKKYPKVDLIIEELQTQTIVDKLKEDSLDAGILVTPLNIKGIAEKHLFYEPFIVYLPPPASLAQIGKNFRKGSEFERHLVVERGTLFSRTGNGPL